MSDRNDATTSRFGTDAEAWLDAHSVPRVPITGDAVVLPDDGHGPDVRLKEAARLAAASPPADRDDPSVGQAPLSDAVAEAVAFIRKSTARHPQSRGRLADKLTARGHEPVVVDLALDRARRERLVDDQALLAALVAEWRGMGRGPRRVRSDLRARGFAQHQIDEAAPIITGSDDDVDPQTLALDVAKRGARRYRRRDEHDAVRLLTDWVAYRGHDLDIAHQAAREAIADDAEERRLVGR